MRHAPVPVPFLHQVADDPSIADVDAALPDREEKESQRTPAYRQRSGGIYRHARTQSVDHPVQLLVCARTHHIILETLKTCHSRG